MDAAQIEVGDVLKWMYEDGRITVIPPLKVNNPSEMIFGLIPFSKDAVEEVNSLRRDWGRRRDEGLH